MTSIAVIGASAAGLAATLSAARAGGSVTLYESRPEIGSPPAPAIVGFDFLWPREIPLERGEVARRLAGLQLRASDGRGPVVEAPLALVDRARFDQRLAAEAEKAGARIVTGAAPGAWESGGHDITIFCDGANTQARRFLAPTRDPGELAWGAILAFEGVGRREGGDGERLMLTLGPHAPGGRSQLNPLGGGRWSHWTFFRGDPANAEWIARRALAVDASIEGWRDVEARFVGVAPDPVYTLPRQLVGKGVLVAGGAAGQGGLEVGLASGWMAGEIAARAARGEAELAEYERRWKARYQKGYERLRRATDVLTHLTDAETRRLLGAWHGARLTPEVGPAAIASHPRGALAAAWAWWLAHART